MQSELCTNNPGDDGDVYLDDHDDDLTHDHDHTHNYHHTHNHAHNHPDNHAAGPVHV